ncbi:MAG: hypothetical protein CMK74_02230 [Pseudomonadales bacterium]|nr:hypothetical protein [Pseudomonadales bacterium]
MLAAIFGMESKTLAHLEHLLDLSIFQTAFDPREIQRQIESVRDAAIAAREVRMRDARLLEKVAGYSEENLSDAAEEESLMESEYTDGVTPGSRDPWTT